MTQNVYNKCCWKILGDITILTCTGLTSISNETSDSDTCSMGTITCSTKFKPTDVINLTS
jgi:hypothetical protein